MVTELSNGRKISGKLMEANQQYVRIETGEGICTFPTHAILVLWETPHRCLSGEREVYGPGLTNGSQETWKSCSTASGYTCSNSYTCLPPHYCGSGFSCPTAYATAYQVPCTCNFTVPGCNTFQIQQPCCVPYQQACTTFPVQQPCATYQYQQQCAMAYQQQCATYQYQQPCGMSYQQQCNAYPYQQPCGTFPVQRPCIQMYACATYPYSTTPPGGGFPCAGFPFTGGATPVQPVFPGSYEAKEDSVEDKDEELKNE